MDELGGVEPAGGVGAVAGPDVARGKGANFEVKVGPITSSRIAYGAHDSAKRHDVAGGNMDFVEVTVEALDELGGAGRRVGEAVLNQHDATPTAAQVGCEGNHTCGDGMDGVAEVGVPSPYAIPIIPQVVIPAKGLRIVGKGTARRTERVGKGVGGWNPAQVGSRDKI